MAYKSCPDCGSRMYNGHCTYCHEETYIYESTQYNDEPYAFSPEFMDKVADQEVEAKKIKENKENMRYR